MTEQELQSVINAVLSSIKTNSRSIGQLTGVQTLSDNDCFEVAGGRKIAYSVLRDLIYAAVKAKLENMQTDIANSVLQSVSFDAKSSTATLTIKQKGYDAISVNVPIATDSQSGFMTAEQVKHISELYKALSSVEDDLREDITNLHNELDAAHGEVMFADLDTLCTVDDMLQGKPACYTVLDTLPTTQGTVTLKVGVLWVYSDNLRHVVMQVLNTNFVLDDDGTFTGKVHNHDVHEYSRTYAYSTAAGTLHTWSKWQEVGGKGIVDRITNVALAKQNKLTAGDKATRIIDDNLETKQIYKGTLINTDTVPVALPVGAYCFNTATKKLYVGAQHDNVIVTDMVPMPDDFIFVDTASGTTYRCDGTTLNNIATPLEVVNNLEDGGDKSALSAEMGKKLKGMIDNVGVQFGTYAEALEAVLASNSVFEWLLVDKVDSGELIKPLWHVNGSLIDATGAVVSLATLTAPVFSRDSGDVYVGTTVTITCPSGSTLYYSVNGIAATSTSDVKITINEASVVKAYLKSGNAVSDIVAKSYGIAVDHKFQFKIKLTGDNSTEYIPVIASRSPRYTMTVDWGDGSTPSEYSNQYFSAKGCGHTYSGTAGDEFTITIRGSKVPYLAFGESLMCNTGALVAILDNTLECQTNFSGGQTNGGFGGCTNLESLSANALSNDYGTPNICFRNCPKLTSLPTGFFANLLNLTSCDSMFYGSSMILTTENMSELKAAIKNVVTFRAMFYGFNGSVTFPNDFFDSVTATITNLWAFSHTANAASISGDAKALYDVLVQKVSQNVNTQYCFNCTGFSNRNQVPSAWGGTGS